MKRRLALAVSLALSLASTASAAVFKNSFISFELPKRWSCLEEDQVFVCQEKRAESGQEAILVFAAKQKGDNDSLEQFHDHLRSPRQWKFDGKDVESTVLKVETTRIKGQTWVDATQDDSELVGFRTRYLATIKGDIAVLVTFSARRDRYAAHLKDFESTLKTLTVGPPKRRRK